MYFIELLVKKFIKKKTSDEEYNPMQQDNITEDSEHCEHIFMPIDSTGETFACSRCGLVINKSEYEKRNFFNDKNI